MMRFLSHIAVGVLGYLLAYCYEAHYYVYDPDLGHNVTARPGQMDLCSYLGGVVVIFLLWRLWQVMNGGQTE